jgi:hypothetical protein
LAEAASAKGRPQTPGQADTLGLSILAAGLVVFVAGRFLAKSGAPK